MRQSIKIGDCIAFIQYYKSETPDTIFGIIWKKTNVRRLIMDVFEAYIEYMSVKRKKYKENVNLIFTKIVKLMKKAKQNRLKIN